MSSRITNYDSLATTPTRSDILSIMDAGLAAIDTSLVLSERLTLHGDSLCIDDHCYDLTSVRTIKVIGIGKASCRAARSLEEILGNRIDSGEAIGILDTTCDIISTHVGTHPRPSMTNVEISQKIVDLTHDLTEEDLVIVIVSGGGSSLLCWPASECTQGEQLYNAFLDSGGTIEELNLVRKHLSLLKGGGLAKLLYPASVLGLIFSDVPGGNLSDIASGPTFRDSSTQADAQAIIEKYNLGSFELVETPKDDQYFERVVNVPITTNDHALAGMELRARDLGYTVVNLGGTHYEPAEELVASMITSSSPGTVVLAGGEPKLVVTGDGGSGGRNLYTDLVALSHIQPEHTFLSFASDGIDNCDAAGAIADSLTLERLSESNLSLSDSLSSFDALTFFESLDQLVVTGITESNVSDLMILIHQSS